MLSYTILCGCVRFINLVEAANTKIPIAIRSILKDISPIITFSVESVEIDLCFIIWAFFNENFCWDSLFWWQEVEEECSEESSGVSGSDCPSP